MTLLSRMELTFANDCTDPRNWWDLRDNECEECQQKSDDLREIETLVPWGTQKLRMCPDCRVECGACGQMFTAKQGRRGVLEDHECPTMEQEETVARPKVDPVDRALEAYIALDTEGRTRLQEPAEWLQRGSVGDDRPETGSEATGSEGSEAAGSDDGMKWQAGKKYKTEGGGVARIYALDGGGDYPIHGAILLDDGWDSTTWTNIGAFDVHYGCQWDLTEKEVD